MNRPRVAVAPVSKLSAARRRKIALGEAVIENQRVAAAPPRRKKSTESPAKSAGPSGSKKPTTKKAAKKAVTTKKESTMAGDKTGRGGRKIETKKEPTLYQRAAALSEQGKSYAEIGVLLNVTAKRAGSLVRYAKRQSEKPEAAAKPKTGGNKQPKKAPTLAEQALAMEKKKVAHEAIATALGVDVSDVDSLIRSAKKGG